ncbi:glycoside hydrolase family 6 protein [Paraburkholderia phenazinium]|uniref:Glucanase n=1 Tax=Paraburkholderia phenazinium TaxID=60549 RepID=A0A1G8MRU6_9BURK|nr:glycoside hydrolase family 6 protein [Paraburkholderia phenazinium]SDI70577.1 endoglucanase [Paraburkholderia phenazinium]
MKRFVQAVGIALAAFFALGQAWAADSFYADPNSEAAVWVRAHADDPRAAKIAASIVHVPTAQWFGSWNRDVQAAVDQYVNAANAAHQVPILVAYNIPERDCGGASAGGAADVSAYRAWIDAFSQGIGKSRAMVVVEPDSLAQLDCFKTPEGQQTRLDLLRYAVSRMRLNAPEADVYLDAGNAHWIGADAMANRLHDAGIGEVKGFALNVSNFYTTQESLAYANAVNEQLSNRFGLTKPVVVDTSRNGNGSEGQWCNPASARLGEPTGEPSGQIWLAWIKNPGTSDGPCGVAPALKAGGFDPDLAVRLIDGE